MMTVLGLGMTVLGLGIANVAVYTQHGSAQSDPQTPVKEETEIYDYAVETPQTPVKDINGCVMSVKDDDPIPNNWARYCEGSTDCNGVRAAPFVRAPIGTGVNSLGATAGCVRATGENFCIQDYSKPCSPLAPFRLPMFAVTNLIFYVITGNIQEASSFRYAAYDRQKKLIIWKHCNFNPIYHPEIGAWNAIARCLLHDDSNYIRTLFAVSTQQSIFDYDPVVTVRFAQSETKYFVKCDNVRYSTCTLTTKRNEAYNFSTSYFHSSRVCLSFKDGNLTNYAMLNICEDDSMRVFYKPALPIMTWCTDDSQCDRKAGETCSGTIDSKKVCMNTFA